MSDVEQGGGTVFTAINISLWPKKGSAAFWYNLKPNGEGDFKTRHAACPVLTGSKWGMSSINANYCSTIEKISNSKKVWNKLFCNFV